VIRRGKETKGFKEEEEGGGGGGGGGGECVLVERVIEGHSPIVLTPEVPVVFE
jgi:hypothetical protein